MHAQRLLRPCSVEQRPLSLEEIDIPLPGAEEVLIRVHACGLCHTDLHIIEGDLSLPRLPLTPGHQIVGTIEQVGSAVHAYHAGERVGVPWLNATCGSCEHCRSQRENLCDNGRFTGYHIDGGFAEYVRVHEGSAYPIPDSFADADAAPLLCAGVIGFRALQLSEIKAGGRLGLYGFGASAHIAIQIARHWGCEVFVFTRSPVHRALAEELGASWTGSASDAPPRLLHSAVIFAPSGDLVPRALAALGKGGTVALAGIHMSPLPSMEYHLIYQEKTVRSVANSTRDNVRELLAVAAAIPLKTEVQTFQLKDANAALGKLKRSEIRGCGVLLTG